MNFLCCKSKLSYPGCSTENDSIFFQILKSLDMKRSSKLWYDGACGIIDIWTEILIGFIWTLLSLIALFLPKSEHEHEETHTAQKLRSKYVMMSKEFRKQEIGISLFESFTVNFQPTTNIRRRPSLIWFYCWVIDRYIVANEAFLDLVKVSCLPVNCKCNISSAIFQWALV